MIIALITLICLVCMISGIALKQGLLLLASTLTWIIFAILMNEYTFTNAAVGNGLLMFGGVMTIICAVLTLSVFMLGRRKIPEIDEEEDFKRQVLRVTKRR